MRRNELFRTTAVAQQDITSAAPTENNAEPKIKIPEECAEAFIAAVEIGYYKEFYRQGLITADELDILLELQKKKAEEKNKRTETGAA